MPAERFLVTGALGCLGAWVVHALVREGVEVVAFDLGDDDARLRLLLASDQDEDLRERAAALVEPVRGDISDPSVVRDVVHGRGITNVVHLAGLQLPFCAADPARGASVNVIGTVNVFEAVKGSAAAGRPIAYSSSVAAHDAPDDPAADPARPGGRPSSLYGVWKFANEATARVYARADGIASVGLRPAVVYGVGRDQGMTSTPTAAMLAAARIEGYEISFAGATQLHYAPDVARAFVAATRCGADGAAVGDLGGPSETIAQVVAAIERAAPEAAGRIAVAGDPLPFPGDLSGAALDALLRGPERTPLERGVAETIDRFRRLVAAGALPARTPEAR